MNISPIAYSYWRVIKAGGRTYASVPVTVRENVRALARADVETGVVSAVQYEALIGEVFQ